MTQKSRSVLDPELRKFSILHITQNLNALTLTPPPALWDKFILFYTKLGYRKMSVVLSDVYLLVRSTIE